MVTMSKFLRVTGITNVTPSGMDGHMYRLSFETGIVTGQEFRPENQWQVDVAMSGTLQAAWGTSETDIAVTSGTAAMTGVLTLASQNRLDELQPINLNTFTAPGTPPKAPIVDVGTMIPIPDHPDRSDERIGGQTFLSDDISEVRDHINAISKRLLRERLLELPQERALIDLYKPATTSEEFSSRVQSLAGMAIAVNKAALAKAIGEEEPDKIGSLNLLQSWLKSLSDVSIVDDVCGILKRLNDLRKGYPAHGDNVDTVLEAYDFFDIRYPVEDFSAAWETILRKYQDAMESMLQFLADERDSRNKQ